MKTLLRRDVNGVRMEWRLDRLLGDCRWARVDELFMPSAASSGPVAAANPALVVP
jgi:hypothetical protein